MRIPTVRIKNDTTGKVKKINACEWAGDLGTAKFRGWSRISESTSPPGDPSVIKAAEKLVVQEALKDVDTQQQIINIQEPDPVTPPSFTILADEISGDEDE